MAAQVARGLQDFGVKKGTKVGLFLPNCPYSIACFFAILKAGGTVVNYNPLYVTREIEQQVEDSETEVMITLDLKLLLPKLEPLVEKRRLKAVVVARLADCLPFAKSLLYPFVKRGDIAAMPGSPAYVTFAELLANDGGFDPVPVEPEEDIALIQYTGGTTGLPKGAIHTHASLVINADQISAWAPETELWSRNASSVCCRSFHVFAVSTVLSYGVRVGATLILLPRFDLDQALKTINRKKPTMMPGVPTLYNAISSHKDIGRFDLTSVKLCLSGGAPLPIEVKQAFESKAGCAIFEGYGLTEAPVTHCNPFSGLQKEGSFGVPFPGTSIEIVSMEDGETVLAARRARRGLHHRAAGDEGLLEAAGRDGGCDPERPAAYRRCRLSGRGRLRLHRRPAEGPDHLQRLQCLSAGGRGSALRTSGRGRGRGPGASRTIIAARR